MGNKKPVTKAQIQATTRWESENYEKILVRLKNGERDKIKEQAEKAGLSLNAYVIEAIRAFGDSEGEKAASEDDIVVAFPASVDKIIKRAGYKDTKRFLYNAGMNEARKLDESDPLTKATRILAIKKEMDIAYKSRLANGEKVTIEQVYKDNGYDIKDFTNSCAK